MLLVDSIIFLRLAWMNADMEKDEKGRGILVGIYVVICGNFSGNF